MQLSLYLAPQLGRWCALRPEEKPTETTQLRNSFSKVELCLPKLEIAGLKLFYCVSVPYYNLSEPKAVPPNQSILPPAIKYPRLPSLFSCLEMWEGSLPLPLCSPPPKFILVNEGERRGPSPPNTLHHFKGGCPL